MTKLLRERFSRPADDFAEAFVASVEADRRLVPFDIQGSVAHARMLAREGILTERDTIKILAGLARLKEAYARGKFRMDVAEEDVHMNVERRLGKIGARLHAGRSRNDQVAADLRLWLKSEIRSILEEIMRLQGALRRQAIDHARTILPGVTHLQHAQPVVFGHVLLSFQDALERDYRRMEDCLKRADVSPLGACALAGTSLAINPRHTAKELGFRKVFTNSIDAVSDRDFAAEFVFCCSLLMTHLSQVAENLILWATPEFGFVEIPDELCTTSSIMPQKKNPDLVELVRGKAGSVYGHLVNLLTTLKALPVGYNRDLQETKPPLFEAAETTRRSLRAIHLAIDGMKVQRERMRRAAEDYSLLATDLAEYLVGRGVAFRDAHRAVARLMRHCEKHKIAPARLELRKLRSFHPSFRDDVYELMSAEASVAAKKSHGGTAPENVEKNA